MSSRSNAICRRAAHQARRARGAGFFFPVLLGVVGCANACPTLGCDANLRLRGNVQLTAQTTALSVAFCFNAKCQDVSLDLANQRCAGLDISTDSAVCATAPKAGATTVSVSVVLPNDAVHDGDRYSVGVSDGTTGQSLASASGTVSYVEPSSGQSQCDLPTCKSATVSF